MNRLKSLRPQQKVQLNDEDKTRFMSCLLRLKTNEGVDTKNSRWFETRFASLCTQSHWKPNEEQMKCLEDCVNRARELYNASANGYDAYHTLSSLYLDLQKLL